MIAFFPVVASAPNLRLQPDSERAMFQWSIAPVRPKAALPQFRKDLRPLGTAASCHERKWPTLLDHFVGAHQKRRRNGEAQCFRCLHVDDEPEPQWLLHRQIFTQ
jgi:hypothetical protein